MKRTLTVILCMLFCTPSLLLAQHMTVTGKVTDQDGLPLVGVTVVVKGTTNGVSSGSDGAYRISGLSSKDVLQFSSIGMVSASVAAYERTGEQRKSASRAMGAQTVFVTSRNIPRGRGTIMGTVNFLLHPAFGRTIKMLRTGACLKG